MEKTTNELVRIAMAVGGFTEELTGIAASSKQS